MGQRLARPGLMAGLSLAILYGTALVPIGRLGVAAVAGLPVAAAILSGGMGAGFFCYGAAGLLGGIIVPEKSGVMLYVVLFGLYPIIKAMGERTGRLWMELLCKAAFFNGALSVLWFGFRGLFLTCLPPVLDEMPLIYLVGNVMFAVYDIGLSRLIALYLVKIQHLVD